MKLSRISLVAVLLLLSMLVCACDGMFGMTGTSATTSTTTTTSKGTEGDVSEQKDYVFEEMPTIRVNCANNRPVISDEEYVTCSVSVESEFDELNFSDVSAGIRTRGNSSLPDDPVRNQAPYRIKFDKKQSMLGLNNGAECKSWVLLKPEKITNAITFFLGQFILVEDGYYCSDAQFVELYLNSEYRGVYLLCEQNQINKNRIDVFETPEGYTSYKTGYLLELNNYPEEGDNSVYTNFGDVNLTDIYGGDLSWETLRTDGKNIHKRHYTIKNDYLSNEQYNFINKYFNNLFSLSYNAIANGKYYELNDTFNLERSEETDAKTLISRYIDLDSLVNMYLIQEITMNTDVGAGSFYISLDMSDEGNGLLTFECPWDFSWAYRDNDRYTGNNYEGLSAATFCSDTFYQVNASKRDRSNPWLILFMKAEWFRDMVRERWTELEEADAFGKTLNEIIRWQVYYEDQFAEHEKKWGELLVKYPDRQLTWLENRLAWLENKFFTMDE